MNEATGRPGQAAAAGAPPSGERAIRSYYGQPVIKPPVWTREIPWYLFTGGLGGASATFAHLAQRSGQDVLARRAWIAALAGVSASPVLLIADLGRPERFLNMLRMVKVTSPMSVGSWVLAGAGTATGLAVTSELTGLMPGVGRVAKPAAALLGLPLATYTGALLSQTSVPAWREARREMPAVFAASAAASAGAAAVAITPVAHAGAARRLTLIGAACELAASQLLKHRLGPELAAPYRSGRAGSLLTAAQRLTAAGAVTIAATRGRSRPAAAAGGAAVLAGAACERWGIFKAGVESARDPRYTIAPQRRKLQMMSSFFAV